MKEIDISKFAPVFIYLSCSYMLPLSFGMSNSKYIQLLVYHFIIYTLLLSLFLFRISPLFISVHFYLHRFMYFCLIM